MTERTMEKCKWPDGIMITLDGEHEVDPCVYQEIETIHNVTAHVWRCKKCGHIMTDFTRQTEWVDDPDWRDERWNGDEWLSDEV